MSFNSFWGSRMKFSALLWTLSCMLTFSEGMYSAPYSFYLIIALYIYITLLLLILHEINFPELSGCAELNIIFNFILNSSLLFLWTTLRKWPCACSDPLALSTSATFIWTFSFFSHLLSPSCWIWILLLTVSFLMRLHFGWKLPFARFNNVWGPDSCTQLNLLSRSFFPHLQIGSYGAPSTLAVLWFPVSTCWGCGVLLSQFCLISHCFPCFFLSRCW